jgi:hypothetical protein
MRRLRRTGLEVRHLGAAQDRRVDVGPSGGLGAQAVPHVHGAGGMTTTSRDDGCAAGRRWVRALLRSSGVELATVVYRPDRPELIVVNPATGMLRVTPDQAVAVAACLTVAVHGFDHLDASELALEADSGEGYHPVIPEGSA